MSTASPRSSRSRLAVSSPYIHVEPEFLVYPPPHFGRCVQNVLTIYNTSTRPCVWKLKSQHPERYIAKPNAAVIAPRSATRVRVTLRDVTTVSPDNNAAVNIAPDTKDRFRLTVKFATPEQLQSVRLPLSGSPASKRPEQSNPLEVDSEEDERNENGTANPNSKTVRAKLLFNSLAAPVDHEKDIIAYFKPGMEAPTGGEVNILPSTYSKMNQRQTDTTPRKTERSLSALQDTPYASPVKDIERRLQQEAQQQEAPKSGFLARLGRKTRKLRKMLLIALLVFALAYAIGVCARLRVHQNETEPAATSEVAPAGDGAAADHKQDHDHHQHDDASLHPNEEAAKSSTHAPEADEVETTTATVVEDAEE